MKHGWLMAGTLMVSGVFIAAGTVKFGEPSSLVAQMEALRLPLTVMFPWVAVFLPGLEILLGVALWFKNWRGAAWLGILPLTAGFSVILAWAKLRGLEVSCGCFGDVLHFSLSAALVRNGVILVMGGLGLREELK
ncbi:MAG: hypothetical protein LBD30_06830 [Verrucomicrobiales bacterium]|jgi:hypothetical protein|nr:hypothetical protein [Verrucomicrobiales bacterium]